MKEKISIQINDLKESFGNRKQWINRIIKNNILCALLLNIGFYLVFYLFWGIHFETNDDSGMASITAGANGVASSRTVFINVILGRILKHITQLLPMYNWYAIFQILCVFFALWIVTSIFLKQNTYVGIISSIILLAYFGFEGYVNLQFTKTAGLSAVAGTILIAYVLEYNHNVGEYILGAIMLIIGSCYRFEACGLVLIILSFVGINYIYNCIKMHKKIKELVKYVVAWVIVLCLILGAKVIDNYAYSSTDEYSQFRTYNELRAELLDHGFPNYNENQELYNSLNISEEDLRLYQNWNFADPDIFNINSMQKLVDAKENKEISLATFKDFIYQILHGIVFERGYIIYLVFVFMIILLDGRMYHIILWNFIIYGGLEFYFYYTDRYLLHRVETVMWLAQCVLLLYYFQAKHCKMKLNIIQSIIIICLALMINSNLYVDSYKENSDDKIYYRDILEEINKDDKHLYVLTTLDELVNKSYDALDAIPFGVRDNITLLGGWSTEAPTENYLLSKYGITNVYRDLVNNSSVYLAGYGDMQDILGYIQRHYNCDAQLEYVRSVESLCVYRVVAK